MGNSMPPPPPPTPPENMLKKMEYESVDKGKADSFALMLKTRHFKRWDERQVCKKRTGVPMKKLPEFLEEFKKNNDLEEEDIKILRDLQYCRTVEDKIKHFCFDTKGGLNFGMVVASNNQVTVDFIISMYVIKFEANDQNSIENMQEDYIKMKALEAFKDNGYIDKINYVNNTCTS